jgi:hypothetical protein
VACLLSVLVVRTQHDYYRAARDRMRRVEADLGDPGTDADVPGGQLVVTWRPDGHVLLSGPAVLDATGTLDRDWMESR